jgi:hypothetical protein
MGCSGEVRFKDAVADRKSLGCYCPGCKKIAIVTVSKIHELELADVLIKSVNPRCRKCGSRGQWCASDGSAIW